MLRTLRIQNFAVVEEVEVSFGPGLTVLTGETGAGKSIVVDALGLLLGGRAEADAVRAGCEEAIIEGVFERSGPLGARLERAGLPDLGDEVCLRRVVGRQGRGKAYVNGSLVTIGVLSQLMRGLIDIAGQHEHVGLFEPRRHRELLDAHGQLDLVAASYRDAFSVLADIDGRIEALGADDAEAGRRAEFLRFQLEELDELSPQPGEDVTLEDERRRLLGSERLRQAAASAEAMLSNEDGVLEVLGRAFAQICEAAKLDGRLDRLVLSLGAAKSELDEVARGLGRYVSSVDSNPDRLAQVEERLDALKKLVRKHAAPLEAVVARRSALNDELTRLTGRKEALAALRAEREKAQARAEERAHKLTSARERAAKALAAQVRAALAQLALPKAAFDVSVAPAGRLLPDGADVVEFFFSANPGEPMRPLGKVASGGEASRLLLALKRALAELDGSSCYVLDEVDAGVSGATAEVVGRLVHEVSRHRQILCITHLPQVAAFADAHLRVEKEERKGRTRSSLVPLPQPELRRKELARMLSGVQVSPEALGAADALLRASRKVGRKAGHVAPGRQSA